MAHHQLELRQANSVKHPETSLQADLLPCLPNFRFKIKPAALGFDFVRRMDAQKSQDMVAPSKFRKSSGSGEKKRYGGLAQLGERLPCKQEVSGSNPLISTKEID